MICGFDELSFSVLSVGIFTHQTGVFDVKARPFSSISYRLSGHGKFEIDGKAVFSKASDVLYLPANKPYKVEYSSGESIVIHIKDCNYFEAESIQPVSFEPIRAAFEQILTHWEQRHSQNKAKSEIFEMLDLLASQSYPRPENDVYVAALEYIKAHCFDTDLSVEGICKVCFVSHSTLQRLFARGMGMSPWNYVLKLRLSYAFEMLIGNKHQVKQVSALCGFTDEKYFSRLFKKTYGLSPATVKGRSAL